MTLSKLTTARDGDYYCKVSNLSNPTTGTINSANIFLKVDEAPKITLQTAVVLPAPAGTAPADYFGKTKMATGGSIRLQVVVTGTDSVENPLRYRWQFNKRDIVGAPSLPTFDLIGAPLTASGKYRCIISNFSGEVTTKELTISVQNAPQITGQPKDINQIEETKLESDIVIAMGAATLRYLWQKQITGPGGVISWQNLTEQKSSRLIIAVPDTNRDSGVYRCLVTNEVGEAISDEIDVIINPIPVADLGPVVGLSTIPFYPTQAMAGEFVRIFGQNLQYTTSVKFGQISVIPVVESSNAILVNVPTTAPLTATPIEVISKNGSDFTESSFTRVTTFANTFREWIDYDLINNNPRIIPFSATPKSLDGSNKFLEQSGYEFGPVWYYFTVPINYRLTVRVTGLSRSGIFLDPSIEIHEEGTSPNNLFFLGPDGVKRFRSIPTASSAIVRQIVETVTVTSQPATNPAVTSRNYMVVVRGTTGDLLPNTSRYGDFNIQLTFAKTTTTPAPFTVSTDGSQSNSDVDGLLNSIANVQDEVAAGNDETRIGGDAGDPAKAPGVIFDAGAEATVVADKTKVSFNVSLEAENTSGDDQFAWQVCDAKGEALLAAWVNSADGSVRFVQPDGTTQLSKVSLVHNTDRVAFEISVDTARATWSVMINGVAASEALPLPQGAQFGQVSTVWDLGPDGVASGASVVFCDFKVEHSVAP